MPRPKVYDDDLRERLIRVTASAIADGGVDAVVLRDVAAAGETSTNAIYTMFASRGGLIDAVVEAARESFTRAQEGAATGDVVGDLRALGVAYRAWALANPALYSVLMGGRIAANGTLGGEHWTDDRTIQPLLAAVRALDDAVPVDDGRSSEDVASVLWAGVHGMVGLEITLWSTRPLPERDRVFDDLLDGLGARWLRAVGG